MPFIWNRLSSELLCFGVVLWRLEMSTLLRFSASPLMTTQILIFVLFFYQFSIESLFFSTIPAICWRSVFERALLHLLLPNQHASDGRSPMSISITTEIYESPI